MRVALFGATGATGRIALDRLIERQHTIRALVRPGSALPLSHAHLQAVEGDATNPAPVLEVLRDQQAAIVLLGCRDRRDAHTLSDATRSIVDGMQRLKIRRLVVVTRGSLAADPGKLTEWFALPLRWSTYRQEALEQEGLVQNSGLDWTLVRPFLLTDGLATGRAKAVPALPPPVFLRTTTRADLAEFVTAQLEAPGAVKQVLLLASKGF